MLDGRFNSSHLETLRRLRFRKSRDNAELDYGIGTAYFAELAPSAPIVGSILIPVPKQRKPDEPEGLIDCKLYDLKVGFINIGRLPENNIRIPDEFLFTSRRHCTILAHSNGEADIFDLASLNGVKINGTLIDGKAALKSGDIVTLGEFGFVIILQ